MQAAVLDFIAGRLRGWVEEHGWAHDVSAAVLAEQAHNPARALEGIRELSEWVKRDDWEQILDGFARCVRITRSESERYPVDPALFQQPEEIALYNAYEQAMVHLDEHGEQRRWLPERLRADAPGDHGVFRHGQGRRRAGQHRGCRRCGATASGSLQAISAMQEGRADLST